MVTRNCNQEVAFELAQNINTILYDCVLRSSRKYPYSPHRRDWNFLGGGGFCKAKKFKVMYEVYLEVPEG